MFNNKTIILTNNIINKQR